MLENQDKPYATDEPFVFDDKSLAFVFLAILFQFLSFTKKYQLISAQHFYCQRGKREIWLYHKSNFSAGHEV
jgi:hypothetical protein